MSKFTTFAAYKKSEKKGFKSRLSYALKVKSAKAFKTLAIDVAAVYFARYVVLDCHGTKRLCFTLATAYAWLPACSDYAKIVDTDDFSVVAERLQARAY